MSIQIPKVEQWLNNQLLSATTIHQYIKIIQKFAKQIESHTQITNRSVIQFLRADGENLSPSKSRWNLRFAAVKKYLEYLAEVGIPTKANVLNNIRYQEVDTTEIEALTFDELIRLIDAVYQKEPFIKARDTLIIYILFNCAMRISELVSLNLYQVDMQARLFSTVKRKGGKIFSTPFNDLVYAQLEIYLRERQKVIPDNNEPALIISKKKQRIAVRTVQAMLKRAGERAKIGRPVTPHLLRHSSVTNMIQLGTPLSVVQGICGHSSLQTTQRYIHHGNLQRRQAITQLGNAVKDAREKNEKSACVDA